jgi:DNA polymerase-3 subunit delta
VQKVAYTVYVPSFFFIGENDFALRKERYRWIREFIQKHGSENVSIMDAARASVRELLDIVSVAPFIAPKRLVVCDTAPRLSKEEMQHVLSSIHPDVLLLVCDSKPDKRQGSVKLLLETAELKTFDAYTPRAVREWVLSEAVLCGCRFANDAALTAFLERLNGDLFAMEQELQKCSVFDDPITEERVLAIIPRSGEQEVWQIASVLSQGNPATALASIEALRAQGEDPYSLWSILLWVLRSVVSLRLAIDDGVAASGLATATRLPPFTVRSLSPIAQRGNSRLLRETLTWACEKERDVKNGGLRTTADAPHELLAAISLLTVRLSMLQ